MRERCQRCGYVPAWEARGEMPRKPRRIFAAALALAGLWWVACGVGFVTPEPWAIRGALVLLGVYFICEAGERL